MKQQLHLLNPIKTKILIIGCLIFGINFKCVSQTLCFNPAANFGSGNTPSSVVSADFNGDGKMDIAVTNQNFDFVSILIGTGTGSFGSPTNFSVGNQPSSIVSGDFNADGNIDLATSNELSNNISVILGTGTGSFGIATDFGAGAYANFLAISDFNGDGNVDFVVTNNGANTVSILLGTGTGSFGTATNFVVGSGPSQVVCADFNSDGNIDIAVSSGTSGNIAVLFGTGTGIFGSATNYITGTNPYWLTTGDFDADGSVDIATSNQGSNNVSVILGTISGTFGAAINYTTTASPGMIINGDFDGDTKIDLAMVNPFSNEVSVLIGNGAGGFGLANTYSTNLYPYFIVSGNFNGTGNLDLASANINSNDISVLLNCSITPTNCTPDINTSLVARYDFTGNANDLSGNGNNGIVNGATLTTDRFGNSNSAYSFDGLSANIQVAHSSSLTFPGNNLSISFWMNVSSWPTSSLEYYLFAKHSGSGSSQAGFHNYIYGSAVPTDPNNALVYRYRDGGASSWGSASRLTNLLPSPGIWFNVIFTTDNTSNKMYVNGVEVDSTVAQVIGANTSDLFMGYDPAGGQYYNGLLDDIRIYNRALSSCDADSLYNMPNPLTTGINQIAENDIVTYPNPSSQMLYINSPLSFDVKIFNVSGQLVKSIANVKAIIDISELEKGFYFLNLCNQTDSTLSRATKFVKE